MLLLSKATNYIMWRTSDTALDCRNMSDFVIRYNRTMDLADYPYCLTSHSKFVYSVTAILLPSLFYIVEDVRNSRKLKNEDILGDKRNHGRKYAILYEILRWIIIILFPLWPLFIFLYKTYPLVKYNWRTGTERRIFKRRLEKICLMVLVVHLLEVFWKLHYMLFSSGIQFYLAFSILSSE